MRLTYKTIAGPANGEFKDRGSRFLSFSFPVKTTEEIKSALQLIKKEHPKAVHYCCAYRLGTEGLQYRVNDDGEPSGSAGRPILGQIDSIGITDVLVVVVRYFGGTLLGIPGLIHAYKTAAAACLSEAVVVEKNIEIRVTLDFDYALLNEVMIILKQAEATIYQQDMQLFCKIVAGIPLVNKETALGRLGTLYGLEIS